MRQGSLFEFFNQGGQGTDHDHDTLDIARGQWSKNMTMTIENLNICHGHASWSTSKILTLLTIDHDTRM